MHIPTLSPEHIIVFSSLIYPSFTFELGQYVAVFMKKRSRDITFLFSLPIYLFVLVIVYEVFPDYFFVTAPELNYCLLSILCVPLLFVLEYVVGYLFIRLKYGVAPVLKFYVAPEWSEISWWSLIPSMVIVVLEELIFRQLWLIFLINDLGIHPLMAIFISASIYGLNHAAFGEQAIFQKIFSGVVYSTIYYVSGYSIFVPMLTHILQNIMLKIIGGRAL